ncbi:MAG: proline--tRNA ligase, partial [Gammaproteobacteria bacterium]
EFIMKDAYSFHVTPESLQEGYDAMRTAYIRMFERMGLEFRPVKADTGSIGGTASEEFQVLADSGEDAIAVSDGADHYAANLELAPALPPATPRPAPSAALAEVATPGQRTIADVAAFLGVPSTQTLKLLMVEGVKGSDGTAGVVALLVRGDHELNAIKAQKLPGVASPLRMASREAVLAATGCEPGYLGPRSLTCPVYADHAALALADFVCGANRLDMHLTGVNWGRDLPEPIAADLRNVVAGDPSPGGDGRLVIRRGIEVGHIFQLGRKYSEAMQASVLDEAGKPVTMYMGCYGIGVTRIVAAAIEQNHDAAGICWPEPLAPYAVVLVPLNANKAPRVAAAAERLYDGLTAAGIEVLLDDRDARPGVKFADAELIGIPHRIVVSERGLDAGRLEYRHRRASANEDWPAAEVVARLRALVDTPSPRRAAGTAP